MIFHVDGVMICTKSWFSILTKAIWDPQVMFYIFHCISILTGHDCNPAPVKSYILVTSWFSMLTGSWFVPSHDFQSWPGHDFPSWQGHDFLSWLCHDFLCWPGSILTRSWFSILTMSWFSILTGHDFVSWPKLLPNAVMIYSSVGKIALRQDALLPNAGKIFYLDRSWFSILTGHDFVSWPSYFQTQSWFIQAWAGLHCARMHYCQTQSWFSILTGHDFLGKEVKIFGDQDLPGPKYRV